MAYWTKDNFVQDLQDGAMDVERAQVKKEIVKKMESASLETENELHLLENQPIANPHPPIVENFSIFNEFPPF